MSDRHEIIADEAVEGSDYTVWSAYVPAQIRFVSPLPYATVVFDSEQQSMYEAFADTREEAYANQAAVIESINDGTFTVQEIGDFELTEEQEAAYKLYMVEELSTKIAEGVMSGTLEQLERDPATGHHPDCDGECGGTGTPTEEPELPGQYL